MGEYKEGSQKEDKNAGQYGSMTVPDKAQKPASGGTADVPRGGQNWSPTGDAGTDTERSDEDDQRGGMGGGKLNDSGRQDVDE
jgi:hypothetical protein